MLKEIIFSFSLKIITSLLSEPLLCLEHCKHLESTPAQVNLCGRYQKFRISCLEEWVFPLWLQSKLSEPDC